MRTGRLKLVVLAFAAANAGCMVPTYHQPAGFSGTFHRQLYGMEPGPNDVHPSEMPTIEARRGIFYPQTAFRDSVPALSRQAEQKRMEPLFLGADPLRPQQAVRRPNNGAL